MFQYLDLLKRADISFDVKPLLSNLYVTNLYVGKTALQEIILGYLSRIMLFFKFNSYDVIWLEKEFFPWLPSWFELLVISKRTKLVVDYDDAIFHQYDQHKSSLVRWLLGGKIASVMRRADVVVCGNAYLADYARNSGANNVVIIPTVVDTNRYVVAPKVTNEPIIIGWIGSPSTAHFLKLIAQPLQEVVACRNVKIVAVGANAEQLAGLPVTRVIWTEKSEVEEIQKFDIGIMPLEDKLFERGKCGYKLIQCMACGKPVVASPVGANTEVVRDAVDGYWASSNSEWVISLLELIDDSSKRKKMGLAARLRVEEYYSLNKASKKIQKLLCDLDGS